MKYRILSIMSLSMSLLLSGCLFYPKPNLRVFIKGPIRLEATIRSENVSPYQILIIGRTDCPIQQLPDVYLEIDENEQILLSEITPEYLFLNSSEPPVDLSSCYDWPEGSFYIYLKNANMRQSYRFITTQDEILQFRASYGAVLWDKEQTKRYAFPLNHEEVVALFGEPGIVFDRVRY